MRGRRAYPLGIFLENLVQEADLGYEGLPVIMNTVLAVDRRVAGALPFEFFSCLLVCGCGDALDRIGPPCTVLTDEALTQREQVVHLFDQRLNGFPVYTSQWSDASNCEKSVVTLGTSTIC